MTDKKRVGIVTLFTDNANYGAQLQNYASIHALTDLGCDVHTIADGPYRFTRLTVYAGLFFNTLSFYKLRPHSHHPSWLSKLDSHKFAQKYLRPDMSLAKGEDIADRYDHFAVGSDQVWNPGFMNKKERFYFLQFARPEQRMTISPSFGVSELPDELKDMYTEALSSFKYLSVREEAGAKIIRELTGREAEVLIDPALSMTGEEWGDFAAPPKGFDVSQPYLLTYLFAERSKESDSQIEKMASEHGLKIYRLLDPEFPSLLRIDPRNFLYLIKNASLVVTHSFHCSLFSFLLGRPFVLMQFDSHEYLTAASSRIATLLSKFSLERKYAGSGMDNDILECDYSEGYKTLEREREKFFSFLKRSLDIKD